LLLIMLTTPHAQVLDLSHTGVGDVVVEALTYRARVEAHCAAYSTPLPPGIDRWHR